MMIGAFLKFQKKFCHSGKIAFLPLLAKRRFYPESDLVSLPQEKQIGFRINTHFASKSKKRVLRNDKEFAEAVRI